MKIIKPILIIGVLIVSFGFSKSFQKEDGGIQIRIKNTSKYNYKDVIVASKSYESINSNEASEYKTFDYAYRYAFVELTIKGNVFTIQPIDFVGETKLKSGKYTYEIDANESKVRHQRLTIKLVKD